MTKSPEMQKFCDDMAEAFFGETKEGCCVACKQPFSSANVYTAAGWKETKISKMCEKCFDSCFSEEEPE